MYLDSKSKFYLCCSTFTNLVNDPKSFGQLSPVSGGWCSLVARDLLRVIVFLELSGFSFTPFSVLSGTFGTLKKCQMPPLPFAFFHPFVLNLQSLEHGHYTECQM